MRRTRLVTVVLLAVALVAAAPSGAAVVTAPPDPRPADRDTHGPDGVELDSRRRPGGVVPLRVDEVLSPPWDPSEYDDVEAKGNTADLVDLPQLHAVYVYPSDRSSRFSTYAAMFQADARAASRFLDDRYGRGLRWDERETDGVRYLDITVVQSEYTYDQLSGSDQFNYVHRDLERVFSGEQNKKFAVWLDAGSQYCGQGHLHQDTRRQADNANQQRTTGIVYRPYDPTGGDGGFCRGRTLLHEVGHNLGALQKVARHAFDGAHCNDDKNDAMCYTAQSRYTSDGDGQFDYQNDDYWDPGATKSGNPETPSDKVRDRRGRAFWATNLNRYVCPVGRNVNGEPTGTSDCSSPNQDPGY